MTISPIDTDNDAQEVGTLHGKGKEMLDLFKVPGEESDKTTAPRRATDPVDDQARHPHRAAQTDPHDEKIRSGLARQARLQ